MAKTLVSLEQRLGVQFKNRDLLRSALTHRSYLNEDKTWELEHNERLEFLGDAVIELVITEALFRQYPNQEGDLTNWRAALVCTKTLSTVADSLGIRQMLMLSRGQAQETSPRTWQYLLGCTFEAILGALYLDQGLEVARGCIHRLLLVRLTGILEANGHRDAKSVLQEKMQQDRKITPTYQVLSESGPDHNKSFRVGVYLGEQLLAEGEGCSIKAAQTAAATTALEAES